MMEFAEQPRVREYPFLQRALLAAAAASIATATLGILYWRARSGPATEYAAPAPAVQPAAPAPVDAAPKHQVVHSTPARREKRIVIDLGSRPQRLSCYDGERHVYAFTCSGGCLGTDDEGPAVVSRKARRVWFAPDRYWMQWWLTIRPTSPAGAARARVRGYNGIHATLKSEYPFLGEPASHGCIRLTYQDAQQVWNWADVGTPIYLRK